MLGLEGLIVAGRVWTNTHSGVQMHEQFNYHQPCSFTHTHTCSHWVKFFGRWCQPLLFGRDLSICKWRFARRKKIRNSGQVEWLLHISQRLLGVFTVLPSAVRPRTLFRLVWCTCELTWATGAGVQEPKSKRMMVDWYRTRMAIPLHQNMSFWVDNSGFGHDLIGYVSIRSRLWKSRPDWSWVGRL